MIFFIFLLLLIVIFIFFFNAYFYIEERVKFKLPLLKYDEKKYLNEVKIVGTHNSLSYKIHNFFSPFAKTQNYDLKNQLKNNVRYFDLRFKIENNLLEGYHNFIKLHINHIEVFNTFIEFLNNNPDQFILIVLKNENFSNHIEIMSQLYDYINDNNLNNYFHFNHLDWNYIPLIKDIKKKIYIVNFIKTHNDLFYYLPWGDNKTFTQNAITISDCYKLIDYEKINLYKDFVKNLKKENLNIFYFSSQYKYIFGLKYYNKFFLKKLMYNIRDMELKNMIYVLDYVDIYNEFCLNIF